MLHIDYFFLAMAFPPKKTYSGIFLFYLQSSLLEVGEEESYTKLSSGFEIHFNKNLIFSDASHFQSNSRN